MLRPNIYSSRAFILVDSLDFTAARCRLYVDAAVLGLVCSPKDALRWSQRASCACYGTVCCMMRCQDMPRIAKGDSN